MTKDRLKNITYTLTTAILITILSYIISIVIPDAGFLSIIIFSLTLLLLKKNFNESNSSLFTAASQDPVTEINKAKDSGASSLLFDHKAFENQNLIPLDFLPIPSLLVDKNFNIIQANSLAQALLGKEAMESESLLKMIGISKESFEDIVKNYPNSNNGVEIYLPNLGKKVMVFLESKAECYLLNFIDLNKNESIEKDSIHLQKMQALGQLSGSIAHDFNNLLTAMLGFCDVLLVRHPPGDKSFTELMQIKQNINRAANLVRQLLAFSRKQVMQPVTINVNDVIADLAILMVRLIGNDIELDIEYEKDVWPVKVDVGQFEQVMVNLAVNARDAMKKSGKLTISTKNLLIDSSFNQKEYYTPIGDEKIVPGEYVLVSIKDNGTGIPLGILDKIFEPFFSTKDASSGTGLGLATVFGIIKQTGGYIRIKTEESIGTTFYIFLRAATLLEDRPEKIKEMNTSEDGMQNIISDRVETTISKLTGKKNRVLIVEDENAVRLFNSHALKTKGYEVLEADCAETAIEVLSNCNGEVDLILTDVIMPGMSGPELAEQVSKQYPDIKFIFTSGYAEDAVSYLSDKNSHFLEKPYTLKELINKVMKVLSSVKEV